MRALRLNLPALCASLLLANAAFAHGGASEAHEICAQKSEWFRDPYALVSLVCVAWLYCRGVARIWSRSGSGHGIRIRDALCFAGGWLTLAVAMLSPLHPWGEQLFSLHMIQHELLMLVAAPLLVLGKPLVAMLTALQPNISRSLSKLESLPPLRTAWRVLSNPFRAWIVFAIALWAWHIPALFQAALANEFVHALQHFSFLFASLLFWWTVVEGRQRALGYGMAVLYMFTTAVHSGFLGAFLTFATMLWYPNYALSPQSWGLTPLEDQQLGGLIMWIPACAIYIAAGLALFAAWLNESEIRLNRRRRALKGEA